MDWYHSRKQERGLINCLSLNIDSDFFSFEEERSLKYFKTDAHCILIVQQKALCLAKTEISAVLIQQYVGEC